MLPAFPHPQMWTILIPNGSWGQEDRIWLIDSVQLFQLRPLFKDELGRKDAQNSHWRLTREVIFLPCSQTYQSDAGKKRSRLSRRCFFLFSTQFSKDGGTVRSLNKKRMGGGYIAIMPNSKALPKAQCCVGDIQTTGPNLRTRVLNLMETE